MNEGFLHARIENIPGELKALRQWVLWRGEQRGDRMTKVPYSAAGNKASSSDSNTWADFGSAAEAYRSGSWDGIGFVFVRGGGLTGIDLDHCVGQNRELEPKAAAIVSALGSYTEYSVSGSGLHVIVRASVEQGIRASSRSRLDIPVEIYSHGRYFTITGSAYGEPAGIANTQNVVDYLREVISPAAANKEKQSEEGRKLRYLGNDELIQAAMSAGDGEKFRRLWGGDTSMYGGDHSRADAALLRMLLFWTRDDIERADCLFRQSGLYREEKWDKRPDYRKRTFEFLMGAGRHKP
jgi:putative DNA primase/helicase